MSLYDSWSAKKLPTQPEPPADPKSVVVQPAAGNQTFTSMLKGALCNIFTGCKQTKKRVLDARGANMTFRRT